MLEGIFMKSSQWVLYNREYLFLTKMNSRPNSECLCVKFMDMGEYGTVAIRSRRMDNGIWKHTPMRSHGFAGKDSESALFEVGKEKAREIWNELRKMGYDQEG
jgi:hypothetical protein